MGRSTSKDDETDEDDDGPKRRSGAATTVHTYKDDETVSPGVRQKGGGAPQTPTPSHNEKSFLHAGVDLRAVIMSFYSIYAPSKLKDIEDILKHFDSREADLFRTLEVKYDVTFARDGTCVPNNGDKVGEAFLSNTPPSSSPQPEYNSKFAVDHQARQLKDKLAKQGQSADKVQAVLSSGSGMM